MKIRSLPVWHSSFISIEKKHEKLASTWVGKGGTYTSKSFPKLEQEHYYTSCKYIIISIIIIIIKFYIPQISSEYDQMCVTNKYETN